MQDEHHSMTPHAHHGPSGAGITLSPKASFALGLVGGILVLCTIGFFVLLSMVMKGGGLSLGSAAGSDNQVAAAAPSAAPSAAPTAPEPAPTPGTVKPIDANDHVLGPKNAPVVLYEWSDYQCPYCQQFYPEMQQLMNDPKYKGKIDWVFRHFPLSFHPNALPAANAAECASEQGKFWEFTDAMYTNQDQESDTFYAQEAGKLGLNMTQFNSCYAAKKYNAKIQQEETDGSAAGVTGTPGTIIVAKDGSKQLVPGAVPYDQLSQMVDTALAASK
jgi:protein-disulfide isomerase